MRHGVAMATRSNGSMTTMSSTAPQRRNDLSTHGRSSSRSAKLSGEEASSSTAHKSRNAPEATGRLKRNAATVEQPSKPAPGKLLRPPQKKVVSESSSVFDVPSSDDEPTPKPTTRRALPLGRPRAPVPTQSRRKTPERQVSDAKVQKVQKSTLVPQAWVSRPITEKPVKESSDPYSIHSTSSEHESDMAAKSAMKRKVSDAPQRTDTSGVVKKPRRIGVSETKARSLGSQAKSAPEALRKMVSRDRQSARVTSAKAAQGAHYSPGLTSDDTGITPSTPPARQSDSEASNSHAPGTITPKQKELWSALLESPETPNREELQRLRLSEKKVAFLHRSSSDIPKRSRLIDSLRLHGSASNESEEEDDDDEKMEEADGTPRRGGKRKVQEAFETRNAKVTQNSHVRTFVSSAGARMTYGETRTLLQEDPKTFEEQLDDMFPDPVPLSSQPIDEELEDPQGAMRSVHELRAAGGSQRFAEDLEALLEDISATTPGSTGRKRSAMCELAEKCADKDFVERMCTTGFIGRMFEIGASETDTIVLFAWGIAVALALKLGTSGIVAQGAWEASHRMEQSYGSLSRLLDMDADIVRIGKDRKTNMSRASQISLAQFKEFVLKGVLFQNGTPQQTTLSPRDVTLRFLESLLRKLRKSGIRDTILDEQVVAKIIEIAQKSLKSPGPRDHCISILEFESGSGKSFPTEQIHAIVTVITSILSMDETYNTTSDLLELTLRLILNLTNNEPTACAIFSSPASPIILQLLTSTVHLFSTCTSIATSPTPPSATHLVSIDRLILTLGATINLAEFSDPARRAALSPVPPSNHQPNPPKPPTTILSSLLHTFLAGRAHLAAATIDDLQAESTKQHSSFSQLQIAHGYLAVLLGNLCQCPAVLSAVREELARTTRPGQSGGRETDTGLRVLMKAVREFITVYRAANGAGSGGHGEEEGQEEGEAGEEMVWDGMGSGRGRGKGGTEEDETWRAWTVRLEGVVRKLEEAEG
ncbi:hypothetical protein P152DRAFT_513712 [Eremomyces bilateralis CBS 781.70]|uniref:Wings apart-like protein C-terminal domain-containing protein n=1 Tax=Eremomyces bilateralis CBS 781.70 TaxID=1392243 RepID=A0A6G1G6M6_9PEZI|nr:uncharacterized protein P152DRAFT_513712 [Eremomyces bilateralis CBS 781.70]KAF1813489.1 hypothetical protein P152DRAFT_513712 [Eremomyces bilateralis CBS 781.70]